LNAITRWAILKQRRVCEAFECYHSLAILNQRRLREGLNALTRWAILNQRRLREAFVTYHSLGDFESAARVRGFECSHSLADFESAAPV
jgi:hypothetical protein